MKTQVIQLDPHDDVISIRDKMSWAKTDRILLVFPRRVSQRVRSLDLRLLRRHAAAQGAELAFVSQSIALRRLAREEGIPAFRLVSRAQRKVWEHLPVSEAPRREAPPPDLWAMRREIYTERGAWQNFPAVRISFFSLAVLTVLALLILFLPSASIQLTPQTKLQTLSIPVSASPTDTAVNLAGNLPARTLSMFVERNRTAPVTGTMTAPGLPALGKVRFRNLTDAAIIIPAGTVVRTTGSPPIRYASIEETTVPAPVGKTVDVAVKALVGGKNGNLAADTLTAIEGDLGASLAVTNPEATAGGTDKVVGFASTADRKKLMDALQAQVLSECQEAFRMTAGAGDLLFPDTMILSQVVSSLYIPAEGQPGDTLSLTLDAQCQQQYAARVDMIDLAQMGLDVNLPAGWEPLPDDSIAAASGQPKTDPDNTTRWILRVERLLRARIDPSAAIQLVQGRRPLVAVEKLRATLPLNASPEIRLTPSWWPWLPAFPFRIMVSSGEG
jgi:hypothetical protein